MCVCLTCVDLYCWLLSCQEGLASGADNWKDSSKLLWQFLSKKRIDKLQCLDCANYVTHGLTLASVCNFAQQDMTGEMSAQERLTRLIELVCVCDKWGANVSIYIYFFSICIW